jgi:hypothetical protein
MDSGVPISCLHSPRITSDNQTVEVEASPWSLLVADAAYIRSNELSTDPRHFEGVINFVLLVRLHHLGLRCQRSLLLANSNDFSCDPCVCLGRPSLHWLDRLGSPGGGVPDLIPLQAMTVTSPAELKLSPVIMGREHTAGITVFVPLAEPERSAINALWC